MRYGIKRVSLCRARITVSEWTTNDCVTSHVPPFICRKTRLVNPARNVRRILVRGSMPACRLRRRKLWKFDYEVVHSEVYLNNYVVSIARSLHLPALMLSKYNINIENCSFCMFSLFNFLSVFPGGQLTPFAPMCGRPCPRRKNVVCVVCCSLL